MEAVARPVTPTMTRPSATSGGILKPRRLEPWTGLSPRLAASAEAVSDSPSSGRTASRSQTSRPVFASSAMTRPSMVASKTRPPATATPRFEGGPKIFSVRALWV